MKNRNKLLKIATLMRSSLNVDNTFFKQKKLALENDFDILSISETWFNSSLTNASVEIPGYRIFRLDRIGNTGAGVCAYVKSVLKAEVLNDLTGITESGLHKLVCIIYRPPEIGVACLENELMPKYIQALSLNRDIVVTGDLNCDLLSENLKGDALRSFCAIVNVTQLIYKPTRVTETSRSLLDIIMVSDPALAKVSGVLEVTIRDHFLVFVDINRKSPKQAPTYVVTRSFRTKLTSLQQTSPISRGILLTLGIQLMIGSMRSMTCFWLAWKTMPLLGQ